MKRPEPLLVLTAAIERDQLERLARRAYPHEACAVVLVRGHGVSQSRLLMPCQNEAPVQARGCRYLLGGQDLARIGMHVAQGWAIDTIFHSHVNTEPAFSSVDRDMATADGVPLYPGVIYKILEVRQGEPRAWAAYRFDHATRDFAKVMAW